MAIYAQRIAIAVLASMLVVACGGGSGGSSGGSAQSQPPIVYSYSVPPDIGDGWQVADIASEGFDTRDIFDMMDRVVNENYQGIDSVAIVRNNKLLLYWFANRELDEFDEWIGNIDRERHVLHSTSKSFTSALVGIAIDQGFIASTQVSFYDLFSYESYANWDERKAEMTLEDALTMRLGLQWDEWSLPYTDPNNDLVALNRGHGDWAKALLDLPTISDPGTVFTYNTAATNAIGQAVQNATGMPLADFANTNLFYPMQITDAEWSRTPTNLPVGGSGLFLKTRDLVKFGHLYLNNGSWQGQAADQRRLDRRYRGQARRHFVMGYLQRSLWLPMVAGRPQLQGPARRNVDNERLRRSISVRHSVARSCSCVHGAVTTALDRESPIFTRSCTDIFSTQSIELSDRRPMTPTSQRHRVSLVQRQLLTYQRQDLVESMPAYRYLESIVEHQSNSAVLPFYGPDASHIHDV